MVCRMESTYHEIVGVLDVKCTAGSTTGTTIEPGIYGVTDNSSMLKSLPPNNVKVKITIDDFRLPSNLSTNKTVSLIKKSFFLYNINIY